MIIGLDIDGVILDTEREYKLEAELYDIKLGKNHLRDKSSQIEDGRYSWTKEQREDFEKNWIKVARKAPLMPGSISIIKMLQKEGHKIVIITGRDESYKKQTEKTFEENNLKFSKIYYGQQDSKLKACKEENVDIMIDDNYNHAEELSQNKILTLYFRDTNMRKLDESKYLREVNNWGEVYKFIYNKNRKKE
jgi:uncharacterized HAD superfamily protein